MGVNRRSVFRAMAAAVGTGIAGCVSGDSTTTVSGDSTTTVPDCGEIVTPKSVSLPVVSGGPTDGDLLEVLHARLTESLVIDEGPFNSVKTSDAMSETEGQPLQFLEVAVDITGEAGTTTGPGTGSGTPPIRDPDALTLSDLTVSLNLDGETHHPAFSSGVPFTPLSEGIPIGMSVPIRTVEQASVRFEARDRVATWDVPDELLAAFDAVPTFSLQEATFTGEECTTPPHDFTHGILELMIENTGDRDGRFQAPTISQDGPSDTYHYFSVLVPSGESVRVERPLEKYESGDLELVGSLEDRIFGYQSKS